MVINGQEYKFAFTIGAYLSMQDLHVDTKSHMSKIHSVMQMAVIMNSEYEAREVLNNPKHKRKVLTLGMLRALDAYQLQQLSDEVDEAYLIGNNITVKTEKHKKK